MSEPSPPLMVRAFYTSCRSEAESLARATAFGHRGALCEWGCLSSWIEFGARRRGHPVDAPTSGGDAFLSMGSDCVNLDRP